MDQIIKASTEASVLIPSVWSRKYYDSLLAELPFNSLIDNSYEGEIANIGSTVLISTLPQFGEASESSEDEAVSAEAVTATQQSLVINKMLTKDFIVTNTAQLQSIPFVDKLRDLAIYSIQKKIQSLIVEAAVPSPAAPDNSIGYNTTTTLVLADLLEAKELLDEQDVPMADRHIVMDVPQLNDVFAITNFTSSDFITSGAPVISGQLPPALLGFQPHVTTAAGANTCYLFHKSFMTMAAQKSLEIKEFDLGGQGKRQTRINITTLMGLKLLDNKRLVTLS